MRHAAILICATLLFVGGTSITDAAKPTVNRDNTVGDDLADVLRSEAETARRIKLARSLGLLITDASSFGPSFLITPRQPWISRGANLTFESEFFGKVALSYQASSLTPHGSLSMPPSPAISRLPGVPPGRNIVSINDIPLGTNEWLLVECFVSGAERYEISIGAGAYPDGRHHNRDITQPAILSSDRRAAASFRPGKERVRWIEIEGFARREGPSDKKSWQFGGCLLTPVRG